MTAPDERIIQEALQEALEVFIADMQAETAWRLEYDEMHRYAPECDHKPQSSMDYLETAKVMRMTARCDACQIEHFVDVRTGEPGCGDLLQIVERRL
jgi:formate dehydrogenase maturation protein FdhE